MNESNSIELLRPGGDNYFKITGLPEQVQEVRFIINLTASTLTSITVMEENLLGLEYESKILFASGDITPPSNVSTLRKSSELVRIKN